MANPQRGEVAIEINGREYTLALDMNAMCEIEEILSTPDKPIEFQDVIKGLMRSNMRYMRAFFWGTFRRHHKDVSLLAVSDLIQEAGGIEPFLKKLNVLLSFTRPDLRDQHVLKEPESPGRPPEARADPVPGTGTRSTSRREKSA